MDIFCIGDDYENVLPTMDEYDELREKCSIVYLKRTPDISTSDLKEKLLEQLKMEKIL